jgi:hypothetical protein
MAHTERLQTGSGNYLDVLYQNSDIERVQEWCSANLMKSNLSKIRVISFSRKTTILNYQYRLGNSFILRTDCIKDLGILIDQKSIFINT